MNHKISHLKGLQRTTLDGSGALASTMPIPARFSQCLGFHGGYEVAGPHKPQHGPFRPPPKLDHQRKASGVNSLWYIFFGAPHPHIMG